MRFFSREKSFADEVGKLIYEVSPDAYFVLEQEKIVECNPAMEKMLGMSREEVLGLHPSQFSPEFQPDGRRSSDAAAAYFAEIAQRGYARFEWSILTLDNQPHPVMVTVIPTIIAGRSVALTFWQDIQTLVDAREAAIEARVRDAQRAEQQSFVVSAMATSLQKLARRDLRCSIYDNFPDEYQRLKTDFNAAVDQLSAVISKLTDNSINIFGASHSIAEATDDLSRRTEQQAASVEETAAALEEISSTVNAALIRADHAGKVIGKTYEGTHQARSVVSEAVSAIKSIEKSSGEINNITSVIDEIAFQTNLLALNAGVEAARAGEAGNGFAVVAQEVRELAQRSAKAAKEIKSLIGASNGHVKNGVALVERTVDELQQVTHGVSEIKEHIEAVVSGAREQAAAISQIQASIHVIDKGVQLNAAMVEETAAATAELRDQAMSMKDLVALFHSVEIQERRFELAS